MLILGTYRRAVGAGRSSIKKLEQRYPGRRFAIRPIIRLDAGGYIPLGFKSGFVAIIGKANVGKSTLFNTLLGQKISITSKKPQTTRNRILDVYNERECQIVFIDTPGIHRSNRSTGLNRFMNRTALSAQGGCRHRCGHDRGVHRRLMISTRISFTDYPTLKSPVLLLINKIDSINRTLSVTTDR